MCLYLPFNRRNDKTPNLQNPNLLQNYTNSNTNRIQTPFFNQFFNLEKVCVFKESKPREIKSVERERLREESLCGYAYSFV